QFQSRTAPCLEIRLRGRPPRIYPLSELAGQLEASRKKAAGDASAFPVPEDLLAVCAALRPPNSGGILSFESDLSTGAGLGSSAAFLLAMFRVLHPELPQEELEKLAVEGEHFQHGHSSGLDVAVSLRGGLQHFENGVCSPVCLESLPHFQVYDSGRPESSTGECVTRSRQEFRNQPELLRDFREVTGELLRGLQQADPERWTRSIRKNHRLLCKLGVVPLPVQKGISDLEAAGFSAKVCGAGSVRGPAAGMVLVSGNAPHPVPDSWRRIDLQITSRGTRILS
ncbi:MAG: mevalonate kinase family protein, partial [Kiritimatiellia bacterium]